MVYIWNNEKYSQPKKEYIIVCKIIWESWDKKYKIISEESLLNFSYTTHTAEGLFYWYDKELLPHNENDVEI
jgi:hypothetical protein